MKGRKRHIVVDIIGNLIAVLVHEAKDSKAGCDVFKMAALKYPSIKAFFGDGGYRGTSVDYVEQTLNIELHISKKIHDTFAVLPILWIVRNISSNTYSFQI